MTEHSYAVGVSFCDGSHNVSRSVHAEAAIKAYVELIEAGITHPDPPPLHHVRMVTMFARNHEGDLIHHIDSGALPCSHRGVQEGMA